MHTGHGRYVALTGVCHLFWFLVAACLLIQIGVLPRTALLGSNCPAISKSFSADSSILWFFRVFLCGSEAINFLSLTCSLLFLFFLFWLLGAATLV